MMSRSSSSDRSDLRHFRTTGRQWIGHGATVQLQIVQTVDELEISLIFAVSSGRRGRETHESATICTGTLLSKPARRRRDRRGAQAGLARPRDARAHDLHALVVQRAQHQLLLPTVPSLELLPHRLEQISEVLHGKDVLVREQGRL